MNEKYLRKLQQNMLLKNFHLYGLELPKGKWGLSRQPL